MIVNLLSGQIVYSMEVAKCSQLVSVSEDSERVLLLVEPVHKNEAM